MVSSRFGRSVSIGFGVFVATNVLGWWFLLCYFLSIKYSGAPALNASQMQTVAELERIFAWGPATLGLLAFVITWTGCVRRLVRTSRF
jgi:hypothetical protein